MNFESDGFAGVGFNVVGETSATDVTPAYGDAEHWGGLCVTYASELDMEVLMGDSAWAQKDDQVLNFYSANAPKVTLPKSIDVVTKCMKWKDFVTSDGNPGYPNSISSLYFVSTGKKGTRSRFNILGLGRYSELANPECTAQEGFVSGK